MTMRKILAVVLCVCAMLSVMAVVAAADDPPPPEPEPTTTAPTTTKKPLADQINEFWEKIKVWLEPFYRFSFQGISQALVVAFQWLLSLLGLNFWEGGLFGFLT